MYKCDVCQLSFNTCSRLANHFRWVHKSSEVFKCEKCDSEFKDKSSWANHIKYCKGPKDEKKISQMCPKCGYDIKRQVFNRHFQKCNGLGTRRQQRKTYRKCDLSQYKRTWDDKYVCNVCNRVFPAQGLAIHIKSCHLTPDNTKKIKHLYYENVPYKLIRQNGFSKKDVKYALEGCKKRSLSDVMKKSHKDGRANHWNFYKESYPEKFFNKFLENSDFKIERDYIRECRFSFYRVDFFFPKINLAIEIDGSQHQRYKHQQEIDKRKDEYLRSLDIEVMRVQWKSLFHDSKKILDNILNILKNKKRIDTKTVSIFNKEQLSKFNEINKQQFEMRSIAKHKRTNYKVSLKNARLLADVNKKEELKQSIHKLFKEGLLNDKDIARTLETNKQLVRILLNELGFKIRRKRAKCHIEELNITTRNKIKLDMQLLIDAGFTIDEIVQKLGFNKKFVRLILKEFFKWDRLTDKYRTIEDLKNETDRHINDVRQIGQHWGYITELSNLWNVSHTQVRRFIHDNNIEVFSRSELKQCKKQQHESQKQMIKRQHRLLFTNKIKIKYVTLENYVCVLNKQIQGLNGLTDKESVKYLRQKWDVSYKEARRIIRHKDDILQELINIEKENHTKSWPSLV